MNGFSDERNPPNFVFFNVYGEVGRGIYSNCWQTVAILSISFLFYCVCGVGGGRVFVSPTQSWSFFTFWVDALQPLVFCMRRTILITTLIILTPISVLLLGAIWLVVYKKCKDSSHSSIINNFLLPVVLLSIGQSIPLAIFGLSVAILFCLNFDKSRDDFAHFQATNKFRELFAKSRYVKKLANVKGSSQVGGKAGKLSYLKKKGFRIPETYVCTFGAYEEYISGDNYVLRNLKKEIENLIDSNKNYSIRSSANIEDATTYSFAGQFESYLNMKGSKSIIGAIEDIWRSIRGDKVAAYLKKIGKPGQDLRMAVIVQEMINPEFSGVVFTKNPINGMDEVIVESVVGFGDALVRDGITPDRWVYKWGEWIERPEEKEDFLPIIKEIVIQAQKIAKKYGKPVNLEYVYNGKKIYWLQLREITTLRNINVYSNKISKEYMPGVIKPLIWDINILVVNSSWKRLFVELIGKDARNIEINNLAKAFCYRAYFNMGVVGDIFELLGMPRESVELLMGIQVTGNERPKFKPGPKTFKYIPKMILFAVKKSMFSKETEKFLISQRKKYDYFNSLHLDRLDLGGTLKYIERLIEANKETSYFGIITQLLMGFYNMMLKRQLQKISIDIEKVSFEKLAERIRDIDPNYYLSILHDKYDALPQDIKHKIQVMSYEDFSKSPEMKDFRKEIEEFLCKFGHLSDSGNDFSTIPWREIPDIILTMIIDFKKPELAKNDKVDIHSLFKSPIKGMFLRTAYKRALGYREYRERITSLYTYGYALFRPYFLHLAKLFKENNFIEQEQDIFHLNLEEIKLIGKLRVMPVEYKSILKKRKREVAEYKDVVLPSLIYGDSLPTPLTENKVFSELKGLATSKGYCEGRLRIIKGVREFHKMEDGDILVIPH